MQKHNCSIENVTLVTREPCKASNLLSRKLRIWCFPNLAFKYDGVWKHRLNQEMTGVTEGKGEE